MALKIGKTDAYLCETCRDTGKVVVQTPKGEAVRTCTADPCQYLAAKYGLAIGVPTDERDATFDTIPVVPSFAGAPGRPAHVGNGDALKHARFFVDGTHPGLFLYGKPGVGKTKIAVAALNACMRRRETARFVRVPDVLIRLVSEGDDDLYDALVAAPVLCLDDVGASQGTDYARRTLQAIFDARQDRGHRTIWTSNLSLGELGEFLKDDRLSSRIAGACKIVEVGGPDHRLSGPKKTTKTATGQRRKSW